MKLFILISFTVLGVAVGVGALEMYYGTLLGIGTLVDADMTTCVTDKSKNCTDAPSKEFVLTKAELLNTTPQGCTVPLKGGTPVSVRVNATSPQSHDANTLRAIIYANHSFFGWVKVMEFPISQGFTANQPTVFTVTQNVPTNFPDGTYPLKLNVVPESATTPAYVCRTGITGVYKH